MKFIVRSIIVIVIAFIAITRLLTGAGASPQESAPPTPQVAPAAQMAVAEEIALARMIFNLVVTVILGVVVFGALVWWGLVGRRQGERWLRQEYPSHFEKEEE